MIRILPAAPLLLLLLAVSPHAAEPIDIGSRLELFVDNHLVGQLKGDAKLHLHKPQAQEVVLVTDEPWEGNTSAYYTIFPDGERYRMYYRGSHYDVKTKKATHREVTCYAESKDGIRWTKPRLGLFEFDGSKDNNIVWDGIGTHCFTPFKDANPDAASDAKYKALSRGPGGLYAFKSADGIRWSLMSKKPVITKGAFDSQNLGFWDPHAKVYREFHRLVRDGKRDILTGTSSDFLKWTDPVFLDYGDAPKEHLYTNAIRPYPRAPHILIGFPTRFLPAKQQVEPTFMSSRDGRNFHRWTEAVIPRTAPQDRDGNRSNYMAWGLVRLPGNEREYSVYATEAYYTGPDSRLRRFTYRVDGFVSVRANEGELITKPLRFDGQKLVVNFTTARATSVRVEMQTADGKPIQGYTLDDCRKIQDGDIAHTVTWKAGSDVSSLAGKPIRLRFQLTGAQLFSLRFSK